jgi:beta-lactamase class A
MKKSAILIALTFFILGFLASRVFFGDSPKAGSNEVEEVRQGGYKLINPLLECDIKGETALNKYVPFEKKIKERIQKEVIDPNNNIYLAMYFRNLNNGPWFGINPDENFSPASLLKVPLLMAYLKLSEEDPDVLKKIIAYNGAQPGAVSQDVVPKDPLQAGEPYTVEDLLNRMIIFSDNEAMSLLVQNISPEDFNRTYSDLGINVPDVRGPDDFMSVKEYASFFRILYNAAYLDKRTSEKALEMLSKVEYKDGLVAGIDDGISVAHKFGERKIEENGNPLNQLHDCGIVYYEKYPYLLCVMTRGKDFQELSGAIAQTSRIVFSEIKKDYL